MKLEALCERAARIGCAALSMLLLTLIAPGCRSTTLPGVSPEPSPLEQVVAAMSQEEWDEADRLLMPILPRLPERESGAGDSSVALQGR